MIKFKVLTVKGWKTEFRKDFKTLAIFRHLYACHKAGETNPTFKSWKLINS
jgi:hypothetical protein